MKVYSCGWCVWERERFFCVCGVEGVKERVRKIKGWVCDWRVERLCLTRNCGRIVRILLCALCMYVYSMEGQQVIGSRKDHNNYAGPASARNCRRHLHLAEGKQTPASLTGWKQIWTNMWNHIEIPHVCPWITVKHISHCCHVEKPVIYLSLSISPLYFHSKNNCQLLNKH